MVSLPLPSLMTQPWYVIAWSFHFVAVIRHFKRAVGLSIAGASVIRSDVWVVYWVRLITGTNWRPFVVTHCAVYYLVTLLCRAFTWVNNFSSSLIYNSRLFVIRQLQITFTTKHSQLWLVVKCYSCRWFWSVNFDSQMYNNIVLVLPSWFCGYPVIEWIRRI